MLKQVRSLLIILFCLALAGAGALYFYTYTHEDTSPPAFQVDEDLIEVSVTDPNEVLLQGLRAYDNVDGDLTSNIRIRSISTLVNESDVTVSYIVFDEASNYATCSRTVRYTDYTPPRFSLTRPMVFNVGETVNFRDSVIVTDVRDGNISGRVRLEETTVVSNTPGSYSALLSATNNMGDTVYLPLTIRIVNSSFSMPSIELSEYLIYIPQSPERPRFRDYVLSVSDPMADDADEISRTAAKVNAKKVDPTTPGTYEVYYYYTGLSGEIATAILTVVVE
jgi:hypothetical protein